MRQLITLFILFIIGSCTNEIGDIKKITSQTNTKVEIAETIEMLYSDSAQVRVRILAPILKRYDTREEAYEEFPEGLRVEFLNKNKNVSSWLEADYAIKKENDNKIYVEQNVVLYNTRDEKLFTDELIWDEKNEEVYTNKAIKIVQPALGDTSFGFGFKADQEFTRFEISNKFSAIKNMSDFSESFK